MGHKNYEIYLFVNFVAQGNEFDSLISKIKTNLDKKNYFDCAFYLDKSPIFILISNFDIRALLKKIWFKPLWVHQGGLVFWK